MVFHQGFREEIANRCLRRIKKIFWPYNEELWAQTSCPNISPQIRGRKWRWLGHTLRKKDGEISKGALRWNPQGKRRRARPKKTWKGQLTEEMKGLNLSWAEVEAQARKKEEGRSLVRGLCPP